MRFREDSTGKLPKFSEHSSFVYNLQKEWTVEMGMQPYYYNRNLEMCPANIRLALWINELRLSNQFKEKDIDNLVIRVCKCLMLITLTFYGYIVNNGGVFKRPVLVKDVKNSIIYIFVIFFTFHYFFCYKLMFEVLWILKVLIDEESALTFIRIDWVQSIKAMETWGLLN